MPDGPLRIFCVEDNALVVMHLQLLIEQAGHRFAGSAARFEDVKRRFERVQFDLALIDIDLADGRTGGEVAEWLNGRGRPSLFITGQDQVAESYAHASLGTIGKPIREDELLDKLSDVATRLQR